MKVFLSSTARDLSDIRGLIADVLISQGHEVLHHENPAFVSRRGFHSHDQCIHAVSDCDILICLIDSRYGSTYRGNAFTFHDQEISFKGLNKKKRKIKYSYKVASKDLSITWCELIQAYQLGKSVITFARQRVLDEKETRRKNQWSIDFVPAYVEDMRTFDLIDWITKQKVDNWISAFTGIKELERGVLAWVRSVTQGQSLKPAQLLKQTRTPPNTITIVVEGKQDQIVINTLISALNLSSRIEISVFNGKFNIFNNLSVITKAYGKSKDIIVLVDADTSNTGKIASERARFENLKSQIRGGTKIHLIEIIPEIEFWLLCAKNQDFLNFSDARVNAKKVYRELSLSHPARSSYEKDAQHLVERLPMLVEQLPDLKEFIELLRKLSGARK